MMRSWRFRVVIGAVVGILVVLAWVRREARIAETPSAAPVAVTPEIGRSQPQTINPDPVVREEPTRPPATDVRDRPSRVIVRHVPFVSQAPFRVWDLPYKEFCEEASVLTLDLWKQGKQTPSADVLDRLLREVQAWEIANLRTWEDTTADETVRLLREYFGYADARVVRDVTIAAMKAELDAQRPLIVPAAGRELSSPYYKPPGPLYHMLVVIGYDDATREFITNDVGTNTKGAGFRFAYDDLFGAMGDWDSGRGAPDTSQKVMIVME